MVFISREIGSCSSYDAQIYETLQKPSEMMTLCPAAYDNQPDVLLPLLINQMCPAASNDQ